jgi:hypothetical protein
MPDINLSSLSGQQKTYNAGATENRPASPVAGELFYDTTLGGLMVYNGVSWSTFLTPAAVLAPTSAVATNVGSGRPYNNGQASISFNTSSELGGSAALYTITSTPGSLTQTGTSSPIAITGLSSNTSYTFTVKASNSYSNATSSATSAITVSTVPDAPVIGTVTDTAVGGQVSIPITSVNTGGSAITNYQWSTDGTTYNTLSPAQASSPIIISGLTNGQSYTFRLKAVNVNGSGNASSVSNSVTPSSQFYLASTFNSSGNYTIPNTATKVALVTFSGASSGGGPGAGGRGGYSSAAIINSPSTGTSYSVTVGASGGGASSFGTLINSGSINTNVSGNASGIVSGNGQGALGGNAGGGSGGAGGNIVLTNISGFGNGLPNAIQYGGGGGGGGNGAGEPAGTAGGAGGGGGSPFGGNGGQGGSTGSSGPYITAGDGAGGQAGRGLGGGGGGGGFRSNAYSNVSNPQHGAGGAGSAGRVLVYVKE